MNERILIIEDDEAILRVLRRALAYEGYRVDTAVDGESGLTQARDHHPDLVILDWMLPGMDGLEVCQRLRAGGSIPVLMLTAKDTLQDRVQGLDAGADDYMVKPFELDELLARIRVCLRRTSSKEGEPIVRVGDLTIDLAQRKVTLRDHEIKLTPTEYDILKMLAQYHGIVLSLHQL